MFLHLLALLSRSLLKVVPSTVSIFLRCSYLKHALESDVEHGVPVVQQVNVQTVASRSRFGGSSAVSFFSKLSFSSWLRSSR